MSVSALSRTTALSDSPLLIVDFYENYIFLGLMDGRETMGKP